MCALRKRQADGLSRLSNSIRSGRGGFVQCAIRLLLLALWKHKALINREQDDLYSGWCFDSIRTQSHSCHWVKQRLFWHRPRVCNCGNKLDTAMMYEYWVGNTQCMTEFVRHSLYYCTLQSLTVAILITNLLYSNKTIHDPPSPAQQLLMNCLWYDTKWQVQPWIVGNRRAIEVEGDDDQRPLGDKSNMTSWTGNDET